MMNQLRSFAARRLLVLVPLVLAGLLAVAAPAHAD